MIRVAVIGGGTSPERDVSLETMRSVLEHFPRGECEPTPVEILADGDWSVDGDAGRPPVDAAVALREAGVEVVFPALHGRGGEDGALQGFLAVAGFACVGSGVAASALALDKARMREVAEAHGLRVPRAVELRDAADTERTGEVLESFGLPVVVKDPTGGSSLDLVIAATADDLAGVLARFLAAPGGRALVEEHVAGTELTCGVLGNASIGGAVRALPAILIRPLKSDWFDYVTKYDPEAVDEICPAPVAPEVRDRVESQSVTAHRAIGADGLTRSDYILTDAGDLFFLELNTLPGLTAASLCPKAAAADGLPFPELIATLVRMALEVRGR